ncbi:amidohydrolase family protein [Acidicapsa ligni]|uniref:amidohydrolase family protein n=1 Tax=Acidicapsa ligni TaxID=542300 RepID=UPI0021DFC11C|nr:amidohydrolase family protein [Acidicapsa ligni]
MRSILQILSPLLVLFCVVSLCDPAQAQVAQVTVLRHVTLIDGNGGPPRKDAALVIDHDRVRAIVSSSAPALKGATIIDLSGKTIMPEIVNCHGHLGLVKGTKMSAANYTEANVRRQLLQYQDYGVGAVMVMGTDRDEAYQWREESHAGKIPGALIYTAGRGFGVPGGLPPAAMGADEIYRPATADEARKDVRELASRTAPQVAGEVDDSPKVSVDPEHNSNRIIVQGKDREAPSTPQRPDLIKMWVDDFWGQFPKMKPEIYGAIIDEAHKHHLRVAAHVYHEEDAQRLVDDGVDVLAHSVRDAEIPDALVAEMKRKHVAYIGTMSLDDFATAYADDPAWLNQPFFRDSLEPGVYEMITSAQYKQSVKNDKKTPAELAALPIAFKNLKKVYDAGLLVALGTDSGATPIRPFGFAEHQELQLLVRAGLSPLEAITVATKNGAELLRASNEFGVLRPGLKASFIVLDKDPSEDIRNTESISAVWKDGVKVSSGPHAH